MQAVQQASVHASEGGTEKLLALTVSVSWQRVYIGLVHFKGCCTSDLPLPLGEESTAACTKTTWVS